MRDLNILRKRRKLRIIRLYGRAHEKKDFPDPWHDKLKVQDHLEEEEEDIESHYITELSESGLHLSKLMEQEKLEMKLEYKDLLEKDIPISIHQEEMGLEYTDLIEDEDMTTTFFQDGSSKKECFYSYDLFKTSISGKRTKIDDIDGRCLSELKEDALHYKIRHNNPNIERMRLEYKDLCDKNTIPSSYEQNM